MLHEPQAPDSARDGRPKISRADEIQETAEMAEQTDETAPTPVTSGDATAVDQDSNQALATAPSGPPTFEAALDEQLEAERTLVRSGILGAIIGAIVCAGIWTGLVALGLWIADHSLEVWPVLLIGVVVGVFAGVFYGGWAGTLYGNAAIERAEMDAEAEEHSHAELPAH